MFLSQPKPVVGQLTAVVRQLCDNQSKLDWTVFEQNDKKREIMSPKKRPDMNRRLPRFK